MIWHSAVMRLTDGVTIDGRLLVAGEESPGRFPEETYHDVYLKEGEKTERLLRLRLYGGWHEYFPWVEFSKIRNKLDLKDGICEYLNTELEDYMLRSFSDPLPGGGKMYIGYGSDIETGLGLLEGLPAPLTRLGFKLYTLGFTWFKDWYFPEGGLEGGEKLQGEKPLTSEHMKRHLKQIYSGTSVFMQKHKHKDGNSIIKNALDRGEEIIAGLKKERLQPFKYAGE